MAWATSASAELITVIDPCALIVVYVAFAIGSSCCILARAMLLVTAGLKTATVFFNKLYFCIFHFFDAAPSGRIFMELIDGKFYIFLFLYTQIKGEKMATSFVHHTLVILWEDFLDLVL